MPDFSTLLKKPAGEAVKPPPLPAGTYPAIIKSYETGESREKKTPYIRFMIGLTAWPDDVDTSETTGIDLSKKQLRTDFYLTEEAMWRFDAFLRDALGLDIKGKSYEEVLPEAVGTPCSALVVQRMVQSGPSAGDTVNDIERLGAAE